MATQQDEPQFSAILTPHRSLSPQGFLILMACVSIVCFGAGIVFLAIGAWPVFGFLGLDILIIYVAFKLNYRAGRLRETVDLWHDNLRITRTFPSGRIQYWDYNPYWVRLALVDQDEFTAHLTLSSHGKSLIFGTFLTEHEKKDFAEIFGEALRSCNSDVGSG